jgi:hypothetical protein
MPPKIIHNQDGTIDVILETGQAPVSFKTEASALGFIKQKTGKEDAGVFSYAGEDFEGDLVIDDAYITGRYVSGIFTAVEDWDVLSSEGDGQVVSGSDDPTEPLVKEAEKEELYPEEDPDNPGQWFIKGYLTDKGYSKTPYNSKEAAQNEIDQRYRDLEDIGEPGVGTNAGQVKILRFLGSVRNGEIVLKDRFGKPSSTLQNILKDDAVYTSVQEFFRARFANWNSWSEPTKAMELAELLITKRIDEGEIAYEGKKLFDLIKDIHDLPLIQRIRGKLFNQEANGKLTPEEYTAVKKVLDQMGKSLFGEDRKSYFSEFLRGESGVVSRRFDEAKAEARDTVLVADAKAIYTRLLEPYIQKHGRAARLTPQEAAGMVKQFKEDIDSLKTDQLLSGIALLTAVTENIDWQLAGGAYSDIRVIEQKRLVTEFEEAYEADFLDAVSDRIPLASGWRRIRLDGLLTDLRTAYGDELAEFLNQHNSQMLEIEERYARQRTTGDPDGLFGGDVAEPPLRTYLELTPANYLVRNASQIWRTASPRSDIPTLSSDIDNWTQVETTKFFKDMKIRLTEEAVIYDTMIKAAVAFRTRSRDSDNYTDDERDIYVLVADAAENAAVIAVEGYRVDQNNGGQGGATGADYLNTRGLNYFKDLLPESALAVIGEGSGFTRAVKNIEDAHTSVWDVEGFNAFVVRVRGGTIANSAQNYANYKREPEKYKVFDPMYYDDDELRDIYNRAIAGKQAPDDVIRSELSKEHAQIEAKLESDFEAFQEFYEANYINNISQLIRNQKDLDERSRLMAMKAAILADQPSVWREFHKAVELDDSLTPEDWFTGEGNDIAQVLLGNDPGKLVSSVADLQDLLQDQETERETEQEKKAYDKYYEANYLDSLAERILELKGPDDTPERDRLITLHNTIQGAQDRVWRQFNETGDLAEGVTYEDWFEGKGNKIKQVLQGAVLDEVVSGVADIQVLHGGQSIERLSELEDAAEEEAAEDLRVQTLIQEERVRKELYDKAQTTKRLKEDLTAAVRQTGEETPSSGQDRSSQPWIDTPTSMAATSLGLGQNAILPGSTFKETGGGLKFFEDTPFFQGLTDEEKEFALTEFTEGQGRLADQESVEETVNMASEITNKMGEFRTEQTVAKDRQLQISQNLGPLPGDIDDPAGGQREAFIRTFDESGEEAAIATLGENVGTEASPSRGGFGKSAQESMKANLKAAKLRATEQLGPRPEPKPTTKPTTPVITGERRGGPTIRRIRRP